MSRHSRVKYLMWLLILDPARQHLESGQVFICRIKIGARYLYRKGLRTAFAVNKDGPANLAKVCVKTNAPLIHISTDFVFDGNRAVPYNELDPVSPLSIYGKSKADGENEVRIQLKEHIILRTSLLYGIHGHNFVRTMLRLGREKKLIKVVDDIWISDLCS